MSHQARDTYALCDTISTFYQTVDQRKTLTDKKAGFLKEDLPTLIGEEPQSVQALNESFVSKVLPGANLW